ncbi:MAG: hypothetical protein IJ719_17795 [Clostridia bacterium]|nr:hypothetical protein [Clostridia bacterium]
MMTLLHYNCIPEHAQRYGDSLNPEPVFGLQLASVVAITFPLVPGTMLRVAQYTGSHDSGLRHSLLADGRIKEYTMSRAQT